MAKNNRLKNKIVNNYPSLENVYGEGLKNVTFKKDRNFKSIEYYDKNLPENSDAYPFHPNPGNYGIRYNPKQIRKNGNKFEAITGDLLHGMHNDPEYNDLYSNFQKATLESYGEDMDYWWDKEENKTDGKDSFIRNEIDGRIRQLIQPNDKEHTIFMNEMTPNMTKAGNKILDYLKTNQKKYGGFIKVKEKMKFAIGGTTADSLQLYNNAIDKANFYYNNSDYIFRKSDTNNKEVPNIINEITKKSKKYNYEAKKYYKLNPKTGSNSSRFEKNE